MIVNGIDVIGYEWVKFVRSTTVKHVVDGKDIILYGQNSKDFAYLFTIVNSVEINDSEYIDVSPGAISRIGSIWVQSNTVDPIVLDVILTDSDATKVIFSPNYVLIICHIDDVKRIDLSSISDKIKILKIGKEPEDSLGNIRNARILKNSKMVIPYFNQKRYPLDRDFYTNVNYTRALNRLNYEILHTLPDEFDLVVGKIDRTKNKINSIYCDYSEMQIEHRHMFGRLRRNMMHMLPVTYTILVADDIKYAKYQYEMSNYDLVTNICELTINDDEGSPWNFAIHWEVENFTVDLNDPKTSNDNIGRTIKLTANLHLFTSIDNYIKNIKLIRDDVISRIEAHYEPSNEMTIITEDGKLVD